MDTNQYHFSNFVNSSVALPQQHSNLEELNIDSHLLAAAAAASASFLRINSLFPPFYLPPQNEGGASTNSNPESAQSAESVSLPSSLNPEDTSNDNKNIAVKKKRVRIRPSRSKGKKHVFTEEEMLALKEGVERYGVGQWKKILNDPHLRPRFHPCRTEIALKDKYRNYWGQAPEETTRKQRSPWTDEEDEELLELLTKYGPYAWKQMLRESKVMKGNGRRAGDIRDRVRNKYSDQYIEVYGSLHGKKSSTSQALLALYSDDIDLYGHDQPGSPPSPRNHKKRTRDEIHANRIARYIRSHLVCSGTLDQTHQHDPANYDNSTNNDMASTDSQQDQNSQIHENLAALFAEAAASVARDYQNGSLSNTNMSEDLSLQLNSLQSHQAPLVPTSSGTAAMSQSLNLRIDTLSQHSTSLLPTSQVTSPTEIHSSLSLQLGSLDPSTSLISSSSSHTSAIPTSTYSQSTDLSTPHLTTLPLPLHISIPHPHHQSSANSRSNSMSSSSSVPVPDSAVSLSYPQSHFLYLSNQQHSPTSIEDSLQSDLSNSLRCLDTLDNLNNLNHLNDLSSLGTLNHLSDLDNLQSLNNLDNLNDTEFINMHLNSLGNVGMHVNGEVAPVDIGAELDKILELTKM